MSKISGLLRAHALAFQYLVRLAHQHVGKEPCLEALELSDDTGWRRWRKGEQTPAKDVVRRLLKFLWLQPGFREALGAGPDNLVRGVLFLQEALDQDVAAEAAAIVELARCDLADMKRAADVIARRVPEVLNPLADAIRKIEDHLALYDSFDSLTVSEVIEKAVANLYFRDMKRNPHDYRQADDIDQGPETLQVRHVQFSSPRDGGVVLPFTGTKKRRITTPMNE